MNYNDRLNAIIPGGAHTYSRGEDQYPANAPQILKRGLGAYVWDADGKKYLDYGMALRAVTLGYADAEVNRAAIEQIELGNNLTRPSLVELAAAEKIIEIIPNADMVKFAKNGSSVTSGAVKLACAFTGRKKIARCLQHPFFSYDDWFISDTAVKRGIPEEIGKFTLHFNFNDAQSLKKLFEENRGEIAGVILEPSTHDEPDAQFLKQVRELCDTHQAVLIFDEMITGFRWSLQGAQAHYGVKPDLSTFGKAMANGFSVAALVGRRDIMNCGGIRQAGQERVFLMSTTHGAEMCGLGAFLKTVEIYQRKNVVDHLWSFGRRLIQDGNAIGREMGVGDHFQFAGAACSPVYLTKDKCGNISLPLRTLFAQEMLKKGVLIPWLAFSLSHGDDELNMTLEALRSSLRVYAYALEHGVEKYLIGPAIKPVFRSKN